MKFLKEIAPYEERINLHLTGRGRLDRQKAQEIDNIFHEFVINSDEKIYPNNKNKKKTDLSCNSCVQSMIQLAANWIRILKEREENKPKKYKAIKEKNTKDVSAKIHWTELDPVTKEEGNNQIDLEDQIAEEEFNGLTKADASADIKGTPRPNNPSKEATRLQEADKMAHLRQALDELGVKYHHKQKAKSLQKLLNKHGG